MATRDEVLDNPTGWVRKHIRSYVESDGVRGHRWNGMNTLLLTTRGRRSGLLRRTALIYGEDGDRYVVAGSTGGGDLHPAWYLNLVANPAVVLQVGADTFAALARTATADERRRLWELMTAIFPKYEDYKKRTAREIPVVILERV